MTTKLLLYAALLTASGGLAFAAIRILRTNRAIATVWPDWEGIKSTTPLWIALALALSLSAATPFIPEKPAKTSQIPQPVPKAETLKLEKEIAQLRNQIKELKQKESTQTQPTPTSPANTPTKNTPEKPRQTAAQTTPNPQQQPHFPNYPKNHDPVHRTTPPNRHPSPNHRLHKIPRNRRPQIPPQPPRQPTHRQPLPLQQPPIHPQTPPPQRIQLHLPKRPQHRQRNHPPLENQNHRPRPRHPPKTHHLQRQSHRLPLRQPPLIHLLRNNLQRRNFPKIRIVRHQGHSVPNGASGNPCIIRRNGFPLPRHNPSIITRNFMVIRNHHKFSQRRFQFPSSRLAPVPPFQATAFPSAAHMPPPKDHPSSCRKQRSYRKGSSRRSRPTRSFPPRMTQLVNPLFKSIVYFPRPSANKIARVLHRLHPLRLGQLLQRWRLPKILRKRRVLARLLFCLPFHSLRSLKPIRNFM